MKDDLQSTVGLRVATMYFFAEGAREISEMRIISDNRCVKLEERGDGRVLELSRRGRSNADIRKLLKLKLVGQPWIFCVLLFPSRKESIYGSCCHCQPEWGSFGLCQLGRGVTQQGSGC